VTVGVDAGVLAGVPAARKTPSAQTPVCMKACKFRTDKVEGAVCASVPVRCVVSETLCEAGSDQPRRVSQVTKSGWETIGRAHILGGRSLHKCAYRRSGFGLFDAVELLAGRLLKHAFKQSSGMN
jgi:hypothetical protein